MKTMISTLKSLILTVFVKEKRLTASPLPGVTLGAGAKRRQKKLQILKTLFRFSFRPFTLMI